MNYDNWKLEAAPLKEAKDEECGHCDGTGKDFENDKCLICNGSGTIETN